MPRSLTSTMITELQKGTVAPIYLVAVQFTSGVQYMWNGIGSVVWNGQTWLGVGNLGAIQGLTQATDITARNVTLTLNGIPNSLLELAIAECSQNYQAQIWFGFIASDGSILADPSQVWLGYTDVPTIMEGGDTSSISITVENKLVARQASNRRYTSEDQAIDFPTDTGFRYVASVQNFTGTWGKPGAWINPSNPFLGVEK